VNNFLVNTADLFNSLSSTVEDKISNISSKITELEILLSVLDAELKSIPLDSMAESAEETTQPMGGSSVAVPAPHEESPLSTTPAAEPNSPHPDYLPFSKLLQVGVPTSAVRAKMIAAGLDPSTLLENQLCLC